MTFNTLQDGKDAKSAVSLQLLRIGDQPAADGMSVGIAAGVRLDEKAPERTLVLQGARQP